MVSLRPAAFEPTPEQTDIIQTFGLGTDLVIEAGAGTGKTKTLELVALSSPNRRGVYFVYNKAIAEDAKSRFPMNVACGTAHSLAFRTTGRAMAHRLNSARIPGWKLAEMLGIRDTLELRDPKTDSVKEVSPVQLARLVSQMVGNFCNSKDREIGVQHAKWTPGTVRAQHEELADFILPLAVEMWEDLRLPNGQYKFEHDHYLKMWALARPRIDADFLLFDEAQDANPVLAGVVEEQGHLQRVLVGDANQAIYGWRGAVDAMSVWNGNRRQLSQSFRFGPRVADEANRWLTMLESNLRLTGLEKLDSRVGTGILDGLARHDERTPNAILCRTNSGALSAAIAIIQAGLRPGIVGGAESLERLARAAGDLQAGRRTDHPDLFLFKDWTEVKDYVKEDEGGADIKVLVKMVEDYGVDTILETTRECTDERYADVVVSTAHRAKGREWERVKVWNDFPQPTEDKPLTREDMMLAYVTVTRAKMVLDRGGLENAGKEQATR